jgi:hypothetical protein
MSKKNHEVDRLGGPGSSHQDRVQGEDEHFLARQMDKPAPGEPTNGPRSKISGGGGERDIHHTHEERPKGKGKF